MIANQSFLSLTKKKQFKFRQTKLSEDFFPVIPRTVHTERKQWNVSGDCLERSGWTTAIINKCGMATIGTANSFNKCSPDL